MQGRSQTCSCEKMCLNIDKPILMSFIDLPEYQGFDATKHWSEWILFRVFFYNSKFLNPVDQGRKQSYGLAEIWL